MRQENVQEAHIEATPVIGIGIAKKQTCIHIVNHQQTRDLITVEVPLEMMVTTRSTDR